LLQQCTFPGPRRGPLPPAGPEAGRLFDEFLRRLAGLHACEHQAGDSAMGISTQPDRLLCNCCYRAACPAPGICCAACQGPVRAAVRWPDPHWPLAANASSEAGR
jgi:hypothetical protein